MLNEQALLALLVQKKKKPKKLKKPKNRHTPKGCGAARVNSTSGVRDNNSLVQPAYF